MSRKGVSSILAAVMMIIVAVAASVIVSGWLSSLSGTHAAALRNTTQTRLGCQFADLYIKNATYNCNSDCSAGTLHNITLYITNSGKKTLRADSIAVQNKTGTIFNFAVDANIAPGDTLRVSNATTQTCTGINNSIEYVIVTSPTCPETASDRLQGSSVVFANC